MNNRYNKKYTPKYDYDLINKKYFDTKLNELFGLGSIYLGPNPTHIIGGVWEKINNVTIGSKTVDGWIRVK